MPTKFLIPKKNGLTHGICISWYSNGNVMDERHYVEGKMIGSIRGWYSNGELSYDGYMNNNSFKEGEIFRTY